MTRHSLYIRDGQALEVEHIENLRTGSPILCIFSVTRAGVSQMYLTHLEQQLGGAELHHELMRLVRGHSSLVQKFGPAFRKVERGKPE